MSQMIENPSLERTVPKSNIKGFLLYIPAILILLNNVFLNAAESSVDNYVLIGCFLVLIFSNLRKGKLSNNFLLALIGAGLAFVSTYINGSGLGSLFTYANLLMFLVLYSEIEITEKQKRTLYFIAMISLLVVVYIFSDLNVINNYYYSIFPEFTALRINPNTMGMIVFFLAFYLLYFCRGIKRIFLRRAVYFAVIVIVLYMLVPSNARTSLFAFLLFLCMSVLDFGKRKKTDSSKLFLILLLMSFFFVFIYIYLSKNMEGLIVFGKNFFSGRQGVWQEALDLIQENFFFGNDNSYMFNNKMASAHNSLLALLFMFGIVPTIIAIVVMFRTYKYAAQRGTPLAIKLIFCCIFIMTFETLLTDANTYYYFALLFLPEGTKE